jgi:hypothetical protein
MAHPLNRVLRRASLFAAIAAGLLLFPLLARAAGDGQGTAVLENEHLRIEVDRGSGAIARILDRAGQIHLGPPPGLADVFRLVLRGADKKDRLILGRSQKLTKVTKAGGTLDLAWSGPLGDTEGGTHRLPVRMEIRLAGPSLEFRLFLQNDTPHKVIEVWYPLVGGLAGIGRGPQGGDTSVMLPTASPTIKGLATPLGELALHYPGQMNMSYSSVFSAKANRALYFASHDAVARLKYYRFFEQSSPAGKDVFACIQHALHTPPGKTFEGSPVVLRFHEGTWTEAGPIYREWFTRTFGLMDPARSWIRRHSFVQDTMFLLPEGTLNYTFKDIPRWAADARDHGVTAVLVSGWHRGGHDNGYPHYEPDPRLGTYDDLRRGLEACHKMGVRVYFFVNYQPAMIESEWFKKELHQYVEMREDGGYGATGWGMGTLWARMGHPKPMTWVDPSFPAYRDALLRQFLKLVEAGADGVHVDKMFPTPMNFNPRCELGPDTSTWEGAIRLTRMLLERGRKINPDFAMSFECNWDRMLEFGNAIWWVGNMSAVRSVFPEMVETRGITSPYDYLGVNNAVRLSQVGLLGPLNYSRSVGWEPWKGLAGYLREVKRIQDSLSEAVFFGEVLGQSGIDLGHEPGFGVEYNVFRSLKSGRRVCILTNSGMEDQRQAIRAFGGNAGGSVRIHVPFACPCDAAVPLSVTVPAERIVFVEELPASGGPGAMPSRASGGMPSRGAAAGRHAGNSDDSHAHPTPRVARACHPSVARAWNPNEEKLRTTAPSGAIPNGGFESGDFTGWIADPNWRVDANSLNAYRGWEGKFFAFSGGQGEAATGRLKSKPFVLDKDGVRLLIAGWNTAPGSNRTWNYVMLKAADGTQLDRRHAPNSLTFTPMLLDGSGYQGKLVYVEAVDDADQNAYSIFCIDDVRTVSLPSCQARPLDPLPDFDDRQSIRLEDDRYRIEVKRANGAITRILDKAGKLELIREPRLAGSFKFTLPLPGKEPWETIEANYVLGKDQALSSCDGQGQRLTLRWQGPLTSRTGQRYDVAAVMGIELVGQSVRFTLEIENRTPYQIGEVFFPILGGVTGLGNTYRELKATRLVRPAGAGPASSDIFFLFANSSDLGDQGAEQFFLYPKELSEPWMELTSTSRRSLYLGVHDPADRSRVLHLELVPGNAQTPRWDGNWPRREELAGLSAGVLISFVEFANHPPGKSYQSAPVLLQAHEGGWQEGQRIYRSWKKPR